MNLYRHAILLVISTALLFITGPAVSDNDARPLYSLGQTHIWIGAAVSLLTLALAIRLWRQRQPAWLQRLGWIALSANAAEALLGLAESPQPPAVRIAHSFLAQLFFTLIAVIALLLSRSGNESPELAANFGLWRFVASATPAMVLLQVALGVVFRHGVLGVLPHILWAFVLAMFLVAVIAATVGTANTEVRRAGTVFLTMAGVQILLGFALFILMSVDVDPLILIVVTAVHTITGALTLAASVVLAIVVRSRISEPSATAAAQ